MAGSRTRASRGRAASSRRRSRAGWRRTPGHPPARRRPGWRGRVAEGGEGSFGRASGPPGARRLAQPAGEQLVEVIACPLALHAEAPGGVRPAAQPALHLLTDADVLELDLVAHRHAL